MRFLLLLTVAARLTLSAQQQQGIDEPLAVWTPGTLDIHQIQTGRGNAALFVFPDGTTMLLDAGEVPERKGRLELGPQRPNASRSVAQWLAHYVRQFSPADHAAMVDYAVVTHYHDDHMGALPALSGLLQIRKLVDRGEEPAAPPYPVVRAYFDFRKNTFKGVVEPLRVGEAGQIRLLKEPDPDFEIRNVAGNGLVWTGGSSNAAVSRFPANWRDLHVSEQPSENDLSLALRLRYGKFRYFTGGDVAGVPLDYLPEWHDLETPIAKVVGPVDVAVLNHHGWLDSTNAFFLQTLRPQAVVIPAWHATHPDHSVVRRLRAPGKGIEPAQLFLTNLLDAPRAVLSYLGAGVFRNNEGHVVIRVAPGGGSYRIYVLNAEQELPTVTAVFGPFTSR